MTAFKLDVSDDWLCESCDKRGPLQSFDLHHINSRSSMGGQSRANRIENLACLCRRCHETKGDLPFWKPWLFKAHRNFMEKHGLVFDNQWINEQISKWEGYERNV